MSSDQQKNQAEIHLILHAEGAGVEMTGFGDTRDSLYLLEIARQEVAKQITKMTTRVDENPFIARQTVN